MEQNNNTESAIAKHFRKVSDETGVHISTQIRMYENGYRIVKDDEGHSDVHLICEPHELLEYTGENEYSLIGNIILKDGIFCSAEIIDCIITNMKEVRTIREFLDEVELIIKEENKND